AVNAEVAGQATRLVAGRRRVLTCHAHVTDPVLWESLRMRELASPRGGGGRIQFFNTFDVAARALAAVVLPPFAPPASEARHVLLAGLGPVSERFIVYLGRTWPFTRERSDERIRVTVTDPLASDKVHALTRRYPRLADACELVPRDIDLTSSGVDLGPLLSAGGPRVTAACVTSMDDAAALTTGLALVHRSRDNSFPVVVCVSQERGLNVLLGTGDGGDSRITLLGMLERGCTPELVLHGSNEILARAIHDEYLRDQLRAGHSIHTNPAMQSWDALAGSLRDSNRRQADHIRDKIESIGCAIAPSAEWDATLLRFTGAEVEQMARMEHQRWVNERKDEGWRHDPGPKNFERKTSPYLVDWELLPDTVKEFDRNTVRNMPAFLARVGLCVHRLPRAHAEDTA
ncbi:MAG: RyR domain-containing protein, partial [Vicinamibacterales bacterium]